MVLNARVMYNVVRASRSVSRGGFDVQVASGKDVVVGRLLVLGLGFFAAARLYALGDLPHGLLAEEVAEVVEERDYALVLLETVGSAEEETCQDYHGYFERRRLCV